MASKWNFDLEFSIGTFFLGFFVLWILFKIMLVLFTRFEKTITIESNLAYGSGRSTGNVVSDKEGKVYKVENVLWLLHFRSAELQAELKPGSTYKVKGFGIRIPALGVYPVLTDAEPV